jgi:TonB family protein
MPAEQRPSTSSAVLEAELTRPAGLAEVAMAAATPTAAAESASSVTLINASGHAMYREFIQTQIANAFTQTALHQAGTMEFDLKGSAPTETSTPKLTRSVDLQLSQQELAMQPATTLVAVRAIIDQYGIPRNLTVAKSSNETVNKKALAAVSEFRFKPATVDNKPVEAAVTIAIKIQKP